MRALLIDVKKLKTYPLASRRSKVSHGAFAKPSRKGLSFREFYDALPDILAAKELRAAVEAIVRAHRAKKPVLWMVGAHVIKVGLTPVLINFLRRKIVTAIALNGAGVIHDFELAFMGSTSEDVAAALADGSFGMAEETHSLINGAIREGARRGLGLGESVGEMIVKRRLPYRNLSVLATCHELGVPATVHVAIGADIIHQQSSADGAAIGKTSLADFRKLVGVVAQLGGGGVAPPPGGVAASDRRIAACAGGAPPGGGVVANFGSAVILPEVFLKAVSIARNLGHAVKDFTACDFDMIRHYRPYENVLKRPTLLGGKAIAITGHHELMIPLLAQAVVEAL